MKKKTEPRYYHSVRLTKEAEEALEKIQSKQDISVANDVFELSIKKVAEQNIALK